MNVFYILILYILIKLIFKSELFLIKTLSYYKISSFKARLSIIYNLSKKIFYILIIIIILK